MLIWTALLGAFVSIAIYFVFTPVWTSKGASLAQDVQRNFDETTLKEDNFELSIVIPAYNEELRLEGMMKETVRYLDTWSRQHGVSYELIVVSDGSTDDTEGIVHKLQRTYMNIPLTFIRLFSNQGKGAAIRQGVLSARGRYILMADADGATDITDLNPLYSKLKSIESMNPATRNLQGMVVGSRFIKYESYSCDPLYFLLKERISRSNRLPRALFTALFSCMPSISLSCSSARARFGTLSVASSYLLEKLRERYSRIFIFCGGLSILKLYT